MGRPLLFAAALFIFATTDVNAQDAAEMPPADGQKLSAIIAKVETRPDFRYVSEISWDATDGYRVVYHTTDKARVEINYDPVTAEPK